MKNFLVVLLLFACTKIVAQSDTTLFIQEIKTFQDELNKEYKDPESSPLGEKAVDFAGHEFFPIDLKFRVTAKLKVTKSEGFFDMKTTGGKTRKHRKYGVIYFSIDGKQYHLPVYQSRDLMKTEKYKDYLFLPFSDLTNGEQTYAAGRYLGLSIPKKGNQLVVDFNQCYNPYCAYSNQYACPLVPEENHLDLKVTAGTRYDNKESKDHH